MIDVGVREIEADLLRHIRHAVLWPSVPLEHQLLPFDTAATTSHYGAFLNSDLDPVGCLTLTEENCKAALPDWVTARSPKVQVQVHKFAVYSEYQGKGIGSALFQHILSEVKKRYKGTVLLHLDARIEQRAWYERMGLVEVDGEKFIKNGPTGNGPSVEYIRLGIVLDAT